MPVHGGFTRLVVIHESINHAVTGEYTPEKGVGQSATGLQAD